MRTIPPAGWTVYRLKYDGSRDEGFAPVQEVGWGYEVQRLSAAGADVVEIISRQCYYKYDCDYFRLLSRNGVIIEAQGLTGGFVTPWFLTERYAENGQKIVEKFDAPFGSIVYRRNADRSIDPSVKTGRLDGQLSYIGTQSDGKVIFVDSAAYPASRLVRIGPGTTLGTNVVGIVSPPYVPGERGDFEVELYRAGESSQAVSVWLKSEDGSAQAGLDYELVNQQVTFAPYEIVKKVTVKSMDDSLVEGDENFYLRVSEPAVATMVNDSWVTVVIPDDDYIALHIAQESDGQWIIYAETRGSRSLELESSDDGGRTWQKAVELQQYLNVPIKFEGKNRLYRAVTR
jgi:hypothetical protein